MFSLEHFTFHRKIFQISELKVRRREKSVHILSVSVTLVWVIMPHTRDFVFIIVCILVQGLNFYCTWGFKLVFEISCSPHIFCLALYWFAVRFSVLSWVCSILECLFQNEGGNFTRRFPISINSTRQRRLCLCEWSSVGCASFLCISKFFIKAAQFISFLTKSQ